MEKGDLVLWSERASKLQDLGQGVALPWRDAAGVLQQGVAHDPVQVGRQLVHGTPQVAAASGHGPAARQRMGRKSVIKRTDIIVP